MHETHQRHRRHRRRVRRRMMMKRRMGMMAAMGHGPCFDDEGHWAPTVEEKIRWLEEYQRDLEQETADVASRIAELRSVAATASEQ